MTTNVTIKSGHDVNYFTSSGGVAGCAGAMGYYTRGGEPPGQWAGRAAGRLGLAGQVDAQVARQLYMENVGPGGEKLVGGRTPADAAAAEKAATAAYRKAHPFASGTELAEFRAVQRAKATQNTVPYHDATVNLVKSVSCLHASYRTDAMLARNAGNSARADALDARADAIEGALMDAAADAVRWLEQHATFTRTGHHSATTGEWRDGDGLVAGLFLHKVSRDGDPHLHVHIALWNRVQRADGADSKWRTLFGRALYQERLGLAPVPDRFVEARLRALGYVMVPRADGNGCEVGGVEQDVMDRFSSRASSLNPQVARMAAEYERKHGHPPSKRTIWLLGQQAAQNTRRPKSEARRTVNGQVHAAELTDAERLAAWEAQTTSEEVRALSEVHRLVEAYARRCARDRGEDAPGDAGDGAPNLPPVPGRVLCDAERHRAARVAVAEVQKHHATWTVAQLRFEVHRALGAGVLESDVAEVAGLAVSGRCGTGVVQVGSAPDVADVTSLGVRASDGVSVFRPPGAERWTTLDHLDLEAHIVGQARVRVVPLVGEVTARRAVAGTDLTPEQGEAVVALLTADRATVPLNAGAGTGKSHALAVFARLWTELTGGRVVGLATSTNAARVLEAEGLPESYNIAEFLGKTEGSDELRRPVPVHAGDVLVVDEATQVSTADLAGVQQAARNAGAWFHPVGDTEQLGSPEAGGVFSLLAGEIPGARLSEVLRFRHTWERDASNGLRAGDVAAVAAYDRRGRVRGGDREATFDRAAAAYLADHLRGREPLLLAGSSADAADLARRVQAGLAGMGRVGPGVLDLADGNMAGPGDLIRARHNDHIDAGGRRLTNRDTLRLVSADVDGVTARRKTGPGAWSAPFRVPAGYLAEHAELDYAGNVHVAQGRTVGPSHLAVTGSLSRRSFYVGMTRGREENTAWVETGGTAPAGKPAYEQATPEQVIKGVMERESAELSATEQVRAGQEWAGGSGHVLHLWSVAVRDTLYPAVDRQVVARLDADQARRYMAEHARDVFHQRLREAQLAGHDITDLVDRVTADRLDGARSVSSVLHSRLEGLGLDQAADVTWAQRTPDGASPLARELAEGLDSRVRELGVRHAAKPEPWLLRNLGHLDPHASPALRAEYERRAGVAQSYREAAGITDPDRSLAAEPHAGNPELETARRAAMRALEIRDEAEWLRGRSRGDLEARVQAGERAVAAAPADVSADLKSAGAGQADAWADHARLTAEGKDAEAEGAAGVARLLEARERELEPRMGAYEGWSATTAQVREDAAKAKAELDRRSPEPEAAGSDTLTGLGLAPAGIEGQEVENPGDPRGTGTGEAGRGPAAQGAYPNPPPPPSPDPEPDDRVARLDAAQARVEEAAGRMQADAEAEQASSDEWAQRQSQAEPEAEGWRAGVPDAEMEPEA